MLLEHFLNSIFASITLDHPNVYMYEHNVCISKLVNNVAI